MSFLNRSILLLMIFAYSVPQFAHHINVEAPQPGKVCKVYVKAGDHVQRGQNLIQILSMKALIEIQAPHAGVVHEVFVEEGQDVVSRWPLIRLEITKEDRLNESESLPVLVEWLY